MAVSSRMGLLMASFLAAGCGSSTPAEHIADEAGVRPGPLVATRSANDALRAVREFSMRRPTPEASMGHLGLADLPLVSTTQRTPGFSITVAQPTTALDLSPNLRDRVLRDGVAERIEAADGMLVPRLAARHLQGLLHRADVRLPLAAVGGFSLTDVDSKLGIEVALEGAADVPGEVIDGYVVYAGGHGSGGHLVHRPTAEGTEDFVVVPDKGTASLRYRVTIGNGVAGLRLVSNTLEFLDGGGTPRLRVARPYVVDAAGGRADATISVEGCAYDTNPAGPWGRPVTKPGARSCVVGVGWDATGLGSPTLVDPAWTTTGSMAVARSAHRAASTGPGRAIIIFGNATAPATCELFDLPSKTWASAGCPSFTPATISEIASGKLLITERSMVAASVRAALYDPATGLWTAAGGFALGREGHSATVLASGKVLIAGGMHNDPTTKFQSLSDLAIFDPSLGTWSSAGTLLVARAYHGAALLKSGKLLFAGGTKWTGSTQTQLVDAEVFDPATGTSATTASMPTPISVSTLVALNSGRVFAGSHVFDPVAATWSPVAASVHPAETTVLLGSGDLLTTTYCGEATDLYAESTGAWRSAGDLVTPRASHTATVLGPNTVLVAGGKGGVGCSITLSSAELFSQQSVGGTCMVGGECLSGFCADGVCCDSACADQCSSCSIPGSLGTCKPVASGPPSSGKSCAPFAVCLSGACLTACTVGSDCLSGFCADGVCCDAKCDGQCQACNLPGKSGTCSPVTGAPVAPRAACAGTAAGTTCGIACNGIDTAACHYPATTTTCSTNACSSGTATHASYCDGAGKCNDVPTSCAPYACDTTACRSSCSAPTDCAVGFTCTSNVCVALPASKLGDPCMDATTCPSGAFCTDGVCCSSIGCDAGSSCSVNKKGTCAKLAGTSCTSGLECGTGFCADNVCCDRACDGQCESCDVAGSFGTCKAILGAPHGIRTKCDAGTTTCSAKTCDGKDGSKCAAVVGAETTCGTASCSSATFTSASTCDGAGNCKSPSPQACAPYGCTTTGCRSDCTLATDCADGFTCAASKCVPSQSAAVCNADRTGSVAKDTGIVTPCVAFRCAGDGKCGTSCGVTEDCMPGYNCDQSSRLCVQAPAASSDSGGCSVSHQDKGTGSATLGVLTGLALLAWQRRNRAA